MLLRRPRGPVVALLAAVVLPLVAVAGPPAPQVQPPGGLTMLIAADDPTASFDFDKGGHGTEIRNGELHVEDADIVYGMFEKGMISFGYRRRERAIIVDVGPFRVPAVPSLKDRAPKPPASVIHTLRLERGKFQYDAEHGKSFTLLEAAPALGRFPPEGIQHLRPELDHVYVFRYRVPEDDDPDGQLVAFQVVDLEPGRSVTLRWRKIPRGF